MLLNCNLQAFYVPLYRKELRKIMCCNKDDAGISASRHVSFLPLRNPLPVSFLVFLVVDGAPDRQYCSSARLYSASVAASVLGFFSHGGFWWQRASGCLRRAQLTPVVVMQVLLEWQIWKLEILYVAEWQGFVTVGNHYIIFFSRRMSS